MPPPLGNVLCEFDQRENGPRQFTIHLDESNRLEYTKKRVADTNSHFCTLSEGATFCITNSVTH